MIQVQKPMNLLRYFRNVALAGEARQLTAFALGVHMTTWFIDVKLIINSLPNTIRPEKN